MWVLVAGLAVVCLGLKSPIRGRGRGFLESVMDEAAGRQEMDQREVVIWRDVLGRECPVICLKVEMGVFGLPYRYLIVDMAGVDGIATGGGQEVRRRALAILTRWVSAVAVRQVETEAQRLAPGVLIRHIDGV